MDPEYVSYQKQVLKNAKCMEETFRKMGYKMVSDGTDTHLILLDLRDRIDGARVERVLELANIATNKNTVPGDKSALIPGGLRLGSPAMTTRGLVEKDFERVCEFIDQGVKLTMTANKQVQGKKLKDFKDAIGEDGGIAKGEIEALKSEVVKFTKAFPLY
jgi:glycine hydroxymethyltransferase